VGSAADEGRETLSGAAREAALDPDRAGDAAEQLVAAGLREAATAEGTQLDAGLRGGAGDLGLRHGLAREPVEVAGGGDMTGCVEAAGVAEAGGAKRERFGPAIHALDEALDAASGVLGEGEAGVVRRRDEQGVEGVGQAE